MNRIFRISSAAVFAMASSLALSPVSAPPALAGTLTCTPTTVSVSPSGGNLLVSCTDAGGSTSTCSVTVSAASPPLTSAGGPVNVSASNCGSPVSWTVSPTTSASGTTVPSFTDTLPANSGTTGVVYTYTVTGTGTPTTAQGSIVVPAPASTGGGGGGTACGAPVTMPWNAAGSSRTLIPVAVGGMAMAQFTVSTATTLNSAPRIVVSNTGGSLRTVWALASSPCSFPASTDPTIGGAGTFTGAYEYYSLSGTPSSWLPVLKPGTTYYVNIKSAGSNPVIVDLYN